MILRNHKGQIAGELRDGIYRKIVHSKKHKFKMFNAYGIDEDILAKISTECKEIRLKEKDTNNIYKTDYDTFVKNGIHKNFDTPQVFLPLKYWVLESTANLALLI